MKRRVTVDGRCMGRAIPRCPGKLVTIDRVYACLRDAVNLARNERIQSLKILRRRLVEAGWNEAIVDDALQMWKRYERG